jgi:phosphoglycerate dehydrogenase-like enzyme
MSKILIFHPEATAYREALLRRVPNAEVVATNDETAFRSELLEAEILVAFRFPVDVLAGAPRLKWIQITSAGTEFLAPVKDRLARLAVTNGKGLHAAPIADYVMTAAVMLHSDFRGFLRDQAAKQWRRRPVQALAGKTLGVLGLGSVGCAVARRGIACEMDVVGLRRTKIPIPGVRQVFSPDELHHFLACCDFVVVTVPITDATTSMIGRDEFAAMKTDAFIINVARGAVIDEPALIEALITRQIAGACLDVFAKEPLPTDSPLWALPNVIITPHIAGLRSDYVDRFIDIFADNLARFARHEELRNLVDFSRGY